MTIHWSGHIITSRMDIEAPKGGLVFSYRVYSREWGDWKPCMGVLQVGNRGEVQNK